MTRIYNQISEFNLENLKYIYIIFITVLFAVSGCDREKIDPFDSAKRAILGKWEIIELGNWPVMNTYPANGYDEYLPDNTVHFFDYESHQVTSQRKYWIDSLLHESITREDGFELVFDYDYEFYENKLRIDSRAFMIYNTHIYRRIN
jgi:hypothetical protein